MKEENIKGLKGIFCFLTWFIVTRYGTLFLGVFGLTIDYLPTISKQGYSILLELITIYVIYALFKKDIIRMINDFKKNNQQYFKKYFKNWFLILILMAVTNAIIMFINKGNTPNNQDAINDMFKNMPIYTFIVSVMLAPVVEELVFRFSLRNIFNNKILFILLSGIVFGSFHVIGSFETALDLLYIIPYSIPGIIFAYTYVKSKNIFVPMWLHFCHNGIMMSIQFIILLFS
ncbi:MAG: CPBP family intramembrane glutamic endopeptidase [Bacilli bacterium]